MGVVAGLGDSKADKSGGLDWQIRHQGNPTGWGSEGQFSFLFLSFTEDNYADNGQVINLGLTPSVKFGASDSVIYTW